MNFAPNLKYSYSSILERPSVISSETKLPDYKFCLN